LEQAPTKIRNLCTLTSKGKIERERSSKRSSNGVRNSAQMEFETDFEWSSKRSFNRVRNGAQIEFETQLKSSWKQSSNGVRNGAQMEFETELKSSSKRFNNRSDSTKSGRVQSLEPPHANV